MSSLVSSLRELLCFGNRFRIVLTTLTKTRLDAVLCHSSSSLLSTPLHYAPHVGRSKSHRLDESNNFLLLRQRLSSRSVQLPLRSTSSLIRYASTVDARASYVPIHFTTLDLTLANLDTSGIVARGSAAGQSVPGRVITPIVIQVLFTPPRGSYSNSSDPTCSSPASPTR